MSVVDGSWLPVDVVEWRGVEVHRDAAPLLDAFCSRLPEHELLGADDALTVRLVAGVGKSAGFPIRATRRLCKEQGMEWGYPEDPELFRVGVSREAALLRFQRTEIPRLRRTLSRGDYGHDVMLVQEAMIRAGEWEGEPSARFTNEFMRAVREWQGRSGMRITGSIDRVSWSRLMEESGAVHSDA